MERDFQLGQSNELVKEGRIYDLHNQYNFAGLALDGRGNVQISFEPNPQHGQGLPSLLMEFREVDYLELSENLGGSPITDVDEMGFKAEDDRDDSWLLSENQANDVSHLFYRFGQGHYIRIHARTGRLQEKATLA